MWSVPACCQQICGSKGMGDLHPMVISRGCIKIEVLVWQVIDLGPWFIVGSAICVRELCGS